MEEGSVITLKIEFLGDIYKEEIIGVDFTIKNPSHIQPIRFQLSQNMKWGNVFNGADNLNDFIEKDCQD